MTTELRNMDITPKNLFPGKEDPDNDHICLIVTDVMRELIGSKNDPNILSSRIDSLRLHADDLYSKAVSPDKLSLPLADDGAFRLYRHGVSVETSKKYYCLRLTEEDAKKWTIVIV